MEQTYIHKHWKAHYGKDCDTVTDLLGNTVAHIVHDECVGLWYVGSHLESVESFAGCGDTLEEALKDWVLGKELGK